MPEPTTPHVDDARHRIAAAEEQLRPTARTAARARIGRMVRASRLARGMRQGELARRAIEAIERVGRMHQPAGWRDVEVTDAVRAEVLAAERRRQQRARGEVVR